MASKRPPRQYPIEWEESDWEKTLWRVQTFRAAVDLIEKVAIASKREQFVNEIALLPSQVMQIAFTVDQRGLLRIDDQQRDRRAVAFAHSLQRSMRELARQQSACIIRQIDVPENSVLGRRKIVVRRDRQKLSAVVQLKRLLRAIQSGSAYKIEAAWFGLTPLAHDYLRAGFKIARRRGDLAGFAGELEVAAAIVSKAMLAPDLLAVILPYAVRVASMSGRRPTLARDEALAQILGIFTEVTGKNTASARRGDHDGPSGPGADFVREVESIFGIELMPEGSTHAIARAKELMAQTAQLGCTKRQGLTPTGKRRL